MATRHRYTGRDKPKRRLSGPLLVAAAVIGALLWLSPQTTGMFASTVSNVLHLPVR
jgi:hypothetical protein